MQVCNVCVHLEDQMGHNVCTKDQSMGTQRMPMFVCETSAKMCT